MVVFDVEETCVKRKLAPLPHKLPQYAYMEMYAPGLTYIPIHVLGFVHVLRTTGQNPFKRGKICEIFCNDSHL